MSGATIVLVVSIMGVAAALFLTKLGNDIKKRKHHTSIKHTH